mmetsp:Transcript_41487/g.97384  ORF Transcript_41487/g.97384 Transcript_41487/m.97384 type:complete len:92 (-) Transcript_41487:539-814(-)
MSKRALVAHIWPERLLQKPAGRVSEAYLPNKKLFMICILCPGKHERHGNVQRVPECQSATAYKANWDLFLWLHMQSARTCHMVHINHSWQR